MLSWFQKIYYCIDPVTNGSLPKRGRTRSLNKFEIKDVSQVIDFLGMMGDAVDNIPGLPGVGEKTAKKLLAEYGNMEGLLENAHLVKGKLGEKIQAIKNKVFYPND